MADMMLKEYAQQFAASRHISRIYKAKTVEALMGDRYPWSLGAQTGFGDVTVLPVNIRDSVKQYTRNKDSVIGIYKAFCTFLEQKGLKVVVDFPPIPVSVSFERQMFIAKYLQTPAHLVSELEDILWVSGRTIEEDLRRLRGEDEDPIQVCGKRFCIPDTKREQGGIRFSSTAHPLFLSPNLTQLLVMLKGLKAMSVDPLYNAYAIATARDIWTQLSSYAKERILLVLTELCPEDAAWYTALEEPAAEHFYTEEQCSRDNVVMDCIKNGKAFWAEYREEGTVRYLEGCRFVPGSYAADRITVTHTAGTETLLLSRITASAYTPEGLL